MILASGLVAAALLLSALLALLHRQPLPEAAALRAAHHPSDAELLARDGSSLGQSRLDFGQRRLVWRELDAVSPAFVAAVLAAEDRNFHHHGGVDWPALLRAAVDWLGGDASRGASTLSMQLAGMLDPRLRPQGRRGPVTKLLQVATALRLERAWSKDEILAAWMNRVSFRGELVGVEAAARGLFARAPHALTRAESLLLASLARAPNADWQTVAGRACRLDADQCRELRRLARRHLASPYRIAEPGEPLTSIAARRLLARGVRQSYIDAGLQAFARATLRGELLRLAPWNVRDGAALVVDNASGQVLAYVANAGPDSQAPAVDAIRARRQAGSTLKPFLYAQAIAERRLTAASLLDDSPARFDTPLGLYQPRNYDERFRGPVSLRTALASSLNVPAVRTLGLVGANAFMETLRRLGFSGMERDGDHYGYSLALGSAPVSLWELAGAYRALARGGVLGPLRLGADDPEGPEWRVFDEGSVAIVRHILADAAARASGFGQDSVLDTPVDAAVKTGTSKAMRDNWCVGFSHRYTVAVWVGNMDGSSMHGISGVDGAGPAWAALMNHLHRDGGSAGAVFDAPPPGVTRRVLTVPGEGERQEWFLAGTEPDVPALLAAGEAGGVEILYPREGAVLARDPDIPASRQVLVPQARGREASWYLNGQHLGSTEEQPVWPLAPGQHRLSLVRDALTVAEVHFRVR